MTDKGHKLKSYFEDDPEEFNERYHNADPVTASVVWALAYPVGQLLHDVPYETNYNALAMIERKIKDGDANYILGGDLYEAYRWEYYDKMGYVGEPIDEEDTAPPPQATKQEPEFTGNEEVDLLLRLWDSNKYNSTT